MVKELSMQDILTISGLELWTHIGVPEEERIQEQRLLIDIALHLESKGNADEVSIDYEKVAQDIQALGKTERKTVEKLASDIAEMILKKYSPESVTITVKKFPLACAEHISLTILRP